MGRPRDRSERVVIGSTRSSVGRARVTREWDDSSDQLMAIGSGGGVGRAWRAKAL
jgi:hypothetical protein